MTTKIKTLHIRVRIIAICAAYLARWVKEVRASLSAHPVKPTLKMRLGIVPWDHQSSLNAARAMDTQARLFLELASECLEELQDKIGMEFISDDLVDGCYNLAQGYKEILQLGGATYLKSAYPEATNEQLWLEAEKLELHGIAEYLKGVVQRDQDYEATHGLGAPLHADSPALELFSRAKH